MNSGIENKSVCLQVNKKNLIKNLAYSFTNSSTVILELVQNARRSGASRVNIIYSSEEEMITVSDDGEGIRDFETLLHVAESGWTEEVKEEENPYGLGFLSALYAAKRLRVQSYDQILCCYTSDLLNFSNIEIEKGEIINGTRVELYGVEIEMGDFKAEALFSGYPIPVTFNGRLIERPHALDATDKTFVDTEIGKVSLRSLPTSDSPEAPNAPINVHYLSDMILYYQGFPISSDARTAHYCGVRNIIHLDPKKFRARMPDREKLYDESLAVMRVKDILKSKWEEALVVIKGCLSQEKFCDWYSVVRHFNLTHLYNDIDWLPADSFVRVVDFPVAEHNNLDRCLDNGPEHIHRDGIGDKLVFTAMEAPDPYRQADQQADDIEAKDFAPWVFLYHDSDNRIMLAEKWALDANHWVYENAYNSKDISVEVKDKAEPTIDRYKAGVIVDSLVFCSEIDFYLKGKFIESDTKNAMVLWTDKPEMQVVIPKDETRGDVVKQSNHFFDDCCEFDIERADLAACKMEDYILLNHSSDDPRELLEELVRSLRLSEYPALLGGNFSLKVSKSGTVVEQA